MRRDLERRLQTLEASMYGSPRVAAYLQELFTMPDEELNRGIIAMATDDPNFRPGRHLSDAELVLLTKEFDRRWPPNPSHSAEIEATFEKIAQEYRAAERTK